MTDSGSMAALQASSPFAGGNSAYLEDLFESFLLDPNSVPENWRTFFQSLPEASGKDVSHAAIRRAFEELVRKPASIAAPANNSPVQMKIQQLIDAYRLEGHVLADISPLKRTEKPEVRELTLSYHGLEQVSPTETFDVGDFKGAQNALTVKDLLAALQATYCGKIGLEFMHIVSTTEREWLQDRVEKTRFQRNYSPEEKKRLLERLTAAEGLEKYLGSKYPGAKRFSLEGADSFIVAMDALTRLSGEAGVREMVVGMAHRGRLNLLVNVLGKLPSELFDEFEGKYNPDLESGDVKYHQGFSSDVITPHGMMHMALAFNPSHLEIVTPVVAGSVRARQEKRKDFDRKKALSIAVHGDAAFAGQGVVMEVLNMSQTRGYTTGGTVHIVINNQVGFTTSNPEDARSTLYCSDVAKMVQAPILHVNADDPEAVLMASQLALEYRMTFHKDVVIDLIGYRRHGHNEADEPAITQPLMYQFIRKHPTTRKLYADRLVAEKVIDEKAAAEYVSKNRERLDAGRCVAIDIVEEGTPVEYAFDWRPHLIKDWRVPGDTAITSKQLTDAAAAMVSVPDNFTLHNRVKKIYEDRKTMAAGDKPMDWGFAENLAYATLLMEGYNVRLSGQDCGRGTFAHRHVVAHDQKTAEAYLTLKHLSDDQGDAVVIDSLLSEEAVLAFEYGYASTDPTTLVIWEAQFGDFANGAQVVIDQFISSGEQKWGRLCGLTMLLPHGYEGMGPEHSSARLERYLQLCAQHNIQVCVPSTPAQVFHMLRRQMIRPLRRPLVVMSPKSLLRHREAVSTTEELTSGEFQLVIGDTYVQNPDKTERVVMCSGKVYYDLTDARSDLKQDNVAIIRVEQLYPFPEEELKAELSRFKNAKEIIWCQEEPRNQGAWYSTQHHFQACLQDGQTLRYAGRAPSAAPAPGYQAAHQQQQNELVYNAIKA